MAAAPVVASSAAADAPVAALAPSSSQSRVVDHARLDMSLQECTAHRKRIRQLLFNSDAPASEVSVMRSLLDKLTVAIESLENTKRMVQRNNKRCALRSVAAREPARSQALVLWTECLRHHALQVPERVSRV